MALFMTLRRPRSRGNGAFTCRFMLVFGLLLRKTPKNQKKWQHSAMVAGFWDCLHVKVKAILRAGSFGSGKGRAQRQLMREPWIFLPV
ncbi:hypothetical protein [Ruegeria sp. HKCCD7559]|uniref:hypothetical protein n=1 Tax=Ruegeria sp. HKCCD7559 TaxID=2683005 RepID=UPI001492B978|nr:hypothetical protein [Ruegeria sp. HKCCD7559]NOC44493.1 hypothetical protein [Ruegeria sp. HKCCD7559]